jgi:threonine/homoserine/homoserine lactone efflux protein
MEIVLPLLLGFFVASVGIIPPGLINMTAAKVSIKDGRSKAISFSIGASSVIFLQTILALLFAKYIDSKPDFIVILQEIGLFFFLALTAYFFWISRKPKRPKEELKIRSNSNRFFLGMLLSGLNLFPIPYYVFVSITLSTYNYFFFDNGFIYPFVLGVVLGSFFVFYLYIIFFKKEGKTSTFIIENANTIIGSITGVISLITILKLIKQYWN